jgi:hypothetical protein
MHKTSKAYAILIATALMLLPLLSAMPVPVSATMTGYTILYRDTGHKVYSNHNLFLNTTACPLVTSSYPTPIRAILDDVKDNGSLVIINMTHVDTHGATSFWLWLSPNGGVDINTTSDSCYAGPLIISNISAPPAVADNYTGYKDPKSGEYFWLGNNAIIGPLPTALVLPKGIIYWVKVTDSSLSPPAASEVSASANTWLPYPTIKISPNKGPVGTTVTVTGTAWDPTKLVNVSFNTGINETKPVKIPLLTPNAAGTFTSTFVVPENSSHPSGTTTARSVNAYYNGTTNYFACAAYTEWDRTWRQIDGMTGSNGNNWAATSKTLGVLSSIYIAANYTNVLGTVTLYWDYNTTSPVILASSIAVNSVTGFFNVSVTVPNALMGTHKITLVDFTFNMNATVKVGPSLVLTPKTGQIGITVTANGYGFPYSHANNVTLTWDFTTYGVSSQKNWTKIYTGSNGLFSTTFTVPSGVGGVHNVTASTNETVHTVAWALFTVIPTLTLSPTSAANNGTVVTVSGVGLCFPAWYDLQINQKDYLSNNTYYLCCFNATNKGVMASFKFVVDSSFQPGTVAVSLYEMTRPVYSLPTLQTWVPLTVTGAAQTAILNQINAIAKNIAGNFTAMQSSLSTISAQTSSISSISTSVSSIQTAANAISPLSTDVYLVIVLSLIAAVASIVAVITLQRKVA